MYNEVMYTAWHGQMDYMKYNNKVMYTDWHGQIDDMKYNNIW